MSDTLSVLTDLPAEHKRDVPKSLNLWFGDPLLKDYGLTDRVREVVEKQEDTRFHVAASLYSMRLREPGDNRVALIAHEPDVTRLASETGHFTISIGQLIKRFPHDPVDAFDEALLNLACYPKFPLQKVELTGYQLSYAEYHPEVGTAI